MKTPPAQEGRDANRSEEGITVMTAGVALSVNRQKVAWDITPVTRDDVDEARRLFLKLHLYNSSLDPRFALAEDWERHFAAFVERALESRDHLALLATSRGQAAGLLLASVHCDSPLWRHREWAEVQALYVERQWRGTGLADALLSRALDWAADFGMPAVQLFVTASNTRATSFYEKQGFRATQAVMRIMLPNG